MLIKAFEKTLLYTKLCVLIAVQRSKAMVTRTENTARIIVIYNTDLKKKKTAHDLHEPIIFMGANENSTKPPGITTVN